MTWPPGPSATARSRQLSRGLGLGWLLLATGCAAANPLMGAGSATPRGRYDFGAGGAIRVVSKGLRGANRSNATGSNATTSNGTDSNATGADASGTDDRQETPATGLLPVGVVRVGLPRGFDLGAVVAGTSARVDGRREWVLRDGSTRSVVLAGFAVIFGATQGANRDRAQRSGAEVPLLYAVEFGGFYEVWAGMRAGYDHFRRDAQGHAQVLRVGGTLGIASGFRYVHAGIELTSEYEHHFRSGPDLDGIALTPAFFVRFRL